MADDHRQTEPQSEPTAPPAAREQWAALVLWADTILALLRAQQEEK